MCMIAMQAEPFKSSLEKSKRIIYTEVSIACKKSAVLRNANRLFVMSMHQPANLDCWRRSSATAARDHAFFLALAAPPLPPALLACTASCSPAAASR